ncbi:hypothetical protein [Umezawaea sp. Da 62-37]|uniref:hypothetical protein n=1 Tax=Umezawaea sp. Da 62-37 TaxID=3075927 RepID=UPI0028F6CCB2|nr:hypothetical protein [Umezawaea sp. Da 62-37]WNV87762.1 hypothetical protein RM788_05595 [Umezawaea sp. Da 62-37]
MNSRLGPFVAVVIAAAALVTTGSSAQAETKTPGFSTPTLSTHAGGVSIQTTTVVSHGIWSCTLGANLPNRWYGGSGGGEQAFGYLNCSHVMPEIHIEVSLYRNGSPVASTDNDKLSASIANAAPSKSPHTSGTYKSGALASVRWPDNTISQIPQIFSGTISL